MTTSTSEPDPGGSERRQNSEGQNWPRSANGCAPPPTGPRNGVPAGGHPHCCLQADSRRILLLAEQALRVGLEAALARRSAFDLVPSCADSVPFTHTILGGPRLCPF